MLLPLLLVALLAPQDAPEFYRAGNGVTSPRALQSPGPNYTSDAMRRQVQGAVFLECIVDTDGMPTKIRVTRSLDPELDQEAIRAMGRWRFEPGTKDGRPVPVLIDTEMTFSMAGRGVPKAPLPSSAQVLIMRRTERDGSTTIYEVTPDRFRRLPAWTPKAASEPPLGAGSAIVKARAWMTAKNPRAGASGFTLLSAVLTRTASPIEQWCYQVNFAPNVSGEVPSTITVVVLLDGSVVEPVTKLAPRQ